MKVTVQNGASHGLSRRDVEAIIPLLPSSWLSMIQQVVLYQGKSTEVRATYYPGKHLLGLFWPGDAASVSKSEGLRELLVSFSVVAEHGELPIELSRSVRARHTEGVSALHAKCLEVLA